MSRLEDPTIKIHPDIESFRRRAAFQVSMPDKSGKSFAWICLIQGDFSADAPVLPFEFTNLADTVGRYADELEKLAKKHGKVDVGPLKAAQQTLMKSAQAYEQAYQQSAASGVIFQRDAAQLHTLNKMLYLSERVLMSPEGLPRRPWFKHHLYAPGFYTGYGIKTIPFVREALEQQQWDEAARGVQVVQRQLIALAYHIDSTTQLAK